MERLDNKSFISRILSGKKGESYGRVFLTAFIIMMTLLLPFIIFNKGIFIYYGDFNAQQIPFSYLLTDSVREGQLGWSWGTDLGSDLLGSYSFYLLTSPFFLISTLFPADWAPYIIPWVLGIKTAVAAVTSYAYIRRFVRTADAAFIGALIYAFSGFQLYNIFFNHFHDTTALFPLMLIALEEHVNSRRRGVFAFSVMLMAVTNYFFFTGQAVFLIIYYIIRCFSPDFNKSGKRFLSLLFEAILGTAAAAFVLLPSALMILSNYRVSEHLSGYDLIAYNDKLRIFRILQSFFMLPDVPARPNLFYSDSAKWSSVAAYLPLFSLAGVISFMKVRRKHWATRLTIVCLIMACVPILNSSFYTLNASYYARWFYMPLLVMSMMTAYALDNRTISWKTGIKTCITVLCVFAAVALLPKKNEEGELILFSLPKYPAYFWLTLAITLGLLFVLIYLLKQGYRDSIYRKRMLAATIASCYLCGAAVIFYGVGNGPYSNQYLSNAIGGRNNVTVDGEDTNGFFRIDVSEGCDNYPMIWGYSSIRCFQSTVSPSIMEFYSSIGIQRDVASRPTTERFALRGLLSCKYYFNRIVDNDDDDDEFSMPGFSYFDTQSGFEVYENDYYIPMGFTYDSYMLEDDLKSRSVSMRDRYMMKAMLLSEEQKEKYSDILTRVDSETLITISEKQYLQDCLDRAETSCYDFTYDSYGFSASIDLEADELVFFSVPYDKGFTAYVNGVETEIEKVNYGFMAIRVPAGEANSIEFTYRTVGLTEGIIISAGALFVLAVYLLIARRFGKAEPRKNFCDYGAPVAANIAYQNAILKRYSSSGDEKTKDNDDKEGEKDASEGNHDLPRGDL